MSGAKKTIPPTNVGGHDIPFPERIDWLSTHIPNHEFCTQAIGDDCNTWRRVSWRDLAVAVDFCVGWMEKTWRTDERTVDRRADPLGPQDPPKPGDVVVYMGRNDIRYVTFFCACSKLGLKALLLSPRNSPTGAASLLKITNCRFGVFTPERERWTTTLTEVCPGFVYRMLPPLWTVFGGTNAQDNYTPLPPRVPYARDHILLILHTSGTTGVPKPVPASHAYIAILAKSSRCQPTPPGRYTTMVGNVPGRLGIREDGTKCDDIEIDWTNPDTYENSNFRTFLLNNPLFHLLGLTAVISSAYDTTTPFVLGPDRHFTPDMFAHAVEQTRPVSAIVPPALLEEFSASPRALAAIASMKLIIFAAAPLAPAVAKILAPLVQLEQAIGMTECSVYPTLSWTNKAPDSWPYLEFAPDYPIEMRLAAGGAGEDELYELVLRNHTPVSHHCAVFTVYPQLDEFRTGDLYRCVAPASEATGAGPLWLCVGRADDMVALSTGEKFHVTPMQKAIEGHPLVSRAVVAGHGRFQSAAVIQPAEEAWPSKWDEEGKPETSSSHYIDTIWPAIAAANAVTPAHGHLVRTHIALATHDRPFSTTPKGSTQRSRVLADYADVIDGLYAQAAEKGPNAEAALAAVGMSNVSLDLQNGESKDVLVERVKDMTRKAVVWLLGLDSNGHADDESMLARPPATSGVSGAIVTDDADIFSLGLDSLQTLQLANALRAATGRHEISTQTVYGHPTVRELATYIVNSGEANGNGPVAKTEEEAEAQRIGAIEAMVNTYTTDLFGSPHPLPADNTLLPEGHHVVVLTGSTGSLGTYLLAALLADNSIEKVYCLNRRADARERQAVSLREKGLEGCLPALDQRVDFLHAKLDAEVDDGNPLGIDPAKYNTLVATVDTVIHNAWTVNFNHPLSAFERPHLVGVRALVRMCGWSRRRAQMMFVSSISTCANVKPPVREEVFSDGSLTMRAGYGESKYVAERIMAAAAAGTPDGKGISTTVLRVGQVGGPSGKAGMWNRNEWVPTIVRTSAALGLVPDTLCGGVDWIAVDTLATVIVELIHARHKQSAASKAGASTLAVFNLVNPTPVPWSTLLGPIRVALRKDGSSEGPTPVAPDEWLAAIEAAAGREVTEADLERLPALKIMDFYKGMFFGWEFGSNGTSGKENGNGELKTTRQEQRERSPVFDTSNATGTSATMSNLGPVNERLMGTWLRQWGYQC